MKTNWDLYRANLTDINVGPIYTAEDVEKYAVNLSEQIIEAKQRASHPIMPTNRREKMPPRLKSMQLKKRTLRKL